MTRSVRLGAPARVDTGGKGVSSWDGRLFLHGLGAGNMGVGVQVLRPERIERSNGLPVFGPSVYSPNFAALEPFLTDAELAALAAGGVGALPPGRVEQVLNLIRTTNYDGGGLSVVAADPAYPENPYRSDASGNPSGGGAYETYRLALFGTMGFVKNPATGQAIAPVGIVVTRATVVVANPRTADATVAAANVQLPVQYLTDQNGQRIQGFEVSATADGRLLAIHSTNVGQILYTWNTSVSPAGWRTPKNLTELYYDRDAIIDGVRLGDRYPLAAQPLRRPDGNPYPRGAQFYGAYLWITQDGSELFNPGTVGRATGGKNSVVGGLSVIGRLTNWTLKHIDGPLNPNRLGNDPTRNTQRGGATSPGAIPSSWGFYREVPNLPIPHLRQRPVIPLFDGLGTNGYQEVSFHDHQDGDYVLFYSMNELFRGYFTMPDAEGNTPNNGIDPSRTADTSGNFNTGQLQAGARFPLEYNGTDDNPGVLGRAIYFPESGAVISPNSASLSSIRDRFTAELFVRRLENLAIDGENRWHYLIDQPGSYALILEEDGKFRAEVRIGGQTYATNPTTAAAPLGEWTHVAMTFDGPSGRLQVYVDGTLAASAATATGSVNAPSTPYFIVGPGVTGGGHSRPMMPSLGGRAIVLIDEVALSRVVRSEAEIRKSAFQEGGSTGPVGNTMPLPLGLRADELRLPGPPATAEQVELGKMLFFDARLSGTGTVSCATCHDPARGFADGLATATGINGQSLRRNSPTVVNRAFATAQFWDGRASTLEEQAIVPIENPEEMGNSIGNVVTWLQSVPGYAQKFQSAFGGAPSADGVKRALAGFQRSLLSGASRVDRWEAGETGALTAAEVRGRALFRDKARCVACHTGSNYSDEQFHREGFLDASPDGGRGEFSGRSSEFKAFKTPTLRDISLTGPYFHNGSVGTLAQVVALYNQGAPGVVGKDPQIQPLNLSAQEQADLVAFLEALEGSPLNVTLPTLPGDSNPLSSLLVNRCSVAAGQTECPLSVRWTAPGSASAGVRARPVSAGVAMSRAVACASGTACPVLVPVGSYVFTLHENGADPASRVLRSLPAMVTQASAGGPSATVMATGCMIPAGETTCPVRIQWTTTNAPLAGLAARAVGSSTAQRICTQASEKPVCLVGNVPAGNYEIGVLLDASNLGSQILAGATVSIAAGSGGSSGGSSGSGSSGSSSSGSSGNPTPGTITIACPASATAGNPVTCTASTTGTITSSYWTVNGARIAACDNQPSCTQTPSAGTYTLQGRGESAGQSVSSNTVTVTVTPAPVAATIAITCPASVVEGSPITCTAATTGTIVGGHWLVNGSRFTACDGQTTCTAPAGPAGSYSIQARGTNTAGQTVSSNMMTITVTPRPVTGTVAISCPATVEEGNAATCTATTTGAFTGGYWLSNGNRVAGCENQPTCTATGGPGTYAVQARGLNSIGQTVSSNTATITVTAKPVTGTVSISCPASVEEGQTATCTASTSGAFTGGYWLINGGQIASCNNQATCSASGGPGTYAVQAFGLNSIGQTVSSNVATITVTAKPAPVTSSISISCSGGAGSISCSAAVTGTISGGYWTVNGARYGACDNRASCSAAPPAGSYTIQAHGTGSAGAVSSNAQTVSVF